MDYIFGTPHNIPLQLQPIQAIPIASPRLSPVNMPRSIDSLSPLEPRLCHHNTLHHWIEPVGKCLIQIEEYRSWYASSESENAVLFFYENPGDGKTYIRQKGPPVEDRGGRASANKP